MSHEGREGNGLDGRKWEKAIDQELKHAGLSKWRNEIERKNSLEVDRADVNEDIAKSRENRECGSWDPPNLYRSFVHDGTKIK